MNSHLHWYCHLICTTFLLAYQYQGGYLKTKTKNPFCFMTGSHVVQAVLKLICVAEDNFELPSLCLDSPSAEIMGVC